MKDNYSLVIEANNIFDGHSFLSTKGYLCIKGNKLVDVGLGSAPESAKKNAKKFIYFDKELVMPGIIDVHTFFTGYAIFHVGADLRDVDSVEDCEIVLQKFLKERNPDGAILGHGWNPELLEIVAATEMIEKQFYDKPVIVFASDRSTCIMNTIAKKEYGFTPETCYPESYYRIMKEYLNDWKFIEKEFKDYMRMLNSKGVTTVKEMGFDNFYGFTNYLTEIEDSDALHLRTFFMSQPVGEKINLTYARKMRKLFTGDKIRFSGFNLMIDEIGRAHV